MTGTQIATGDRYRPSETSLARLRQVRFVAVVGPSASGKTTLIRRAVAEHRQLHPVVTTTSRPRRPGEVDGVDYRFSSRTAMATTIASGGYAQVAPSVFGDLYATAAEDYATEGIAMMPVLADAVPDFEALPFASLLVVFVAPPDLATWQRRLAEHGFDPDAVLRRMVEACRSIDFALANPAVPIVGNHDLDRAVADFTAIVLDGRLPRELGEGQRAARVHLGRLRDDLAAFHSI